METYVDNFSYALGSQVFSLKESASAGRLVSSVAALEESGFASHHICTDSETAYDLARDCLNKIKDQVFDIGAVIYSTCLPLNGNNGDPEKFRTTRDVKHLMDFPASHLQADFGLNEAIVIGLNQQACTGMLGSLRLAKALMHSEPEIKKVLCVTADRFPEGALYEQSYNLISDGAAACLVSSKESGFRILASHAITNGGLAFASDEETAGTYFVYTHRAIMEVLQKAGLTLSEINWIVPQNMNLKAWQILCRVLKFDEQRLCCPTRNEVGHVISGDNIINMSHLISRGLFSRGEKILLVMAGYGLNWQCCVLECC